MKLLKLLIPVFFALSFPVFAQELSTASITIEHCKTSHCNPKLKFKGDISPQAFDNLKKVYEEYSNLKPKQNQISFDSLGGNVQASFQIGNFLREHEFHSFIESGNICLSACGFAFIGATHKTVSSDALFGVHLHNSSGIFKGHFNSETGLLNPISAQDLLFFSNSTLEAQRQIEVYLEHMGIGPQLGKLILNTPYTIDFVKPNMCFIRPSCLKPLSLDNTTKRKRPSKNECEVTTPYSRDNYIPAPSCLTYDELEVMLTP